MPCFHAGVRLFTSIGHQKAQRLAAEMLLPRSNLREEELRKSANIDRKYKIRAKIGQHLVRYCMHEDAKRASFWAYERVSPSRAKNSISRSLSPAANPFDESHGGGLPKGALAALGS